MFAARYHSLVVDPASLPADLTVIARDHVGTIMAVADEAAATYGVQFHPESSLTRQGFRLLANFLVVAGMAVDARRVDALDADVAKQAGWAAVPPEPPPPVITF